MTTNDGIAYGSLLNLPGATLSIGHLAHTKNGTLKVWSLSFQHYDRGHNDLLHTAVARNVQLTGKDRKLLRLELDNGTHLDCSYGQRLLVLDECDYPIYWRVREAGQTRVGSWLKSMGTDPRFVCVGKERFAVFRKVVGVEALSGLHDVYNMEVPSSGCFYANHILVHT